LPAFWRRRYAALKEERTQCLWAALERAIPDIRERTRLKLVGPGRLAVGGWQQARC
jgi:hypothetical protein